MDQMSPLPHDDDMVPNDPATDDPASDNPPPPPPPGVPPGPAPRLTRSRTDRVAAGVAGGLGQYFGVDPIIFRIAFVALTLAGGAGVALYGAAWLLIPEEGASDSVIGEALHDRRDIGKRPPIWAIILIALGCIWAFNALTLGLFGGWGHHDGFWFPLLVIGAGWFLWNRSKHHVPAAPPSWPPQSSPTATSGAGADDAYDYGYGYDYGTSSWSSDSGWTPVASRTASAPASPRTRQPSIVGVLLGGMAVVGGLVAMLDFVGLAHISFRGFLGGALVATGAGLILSIWRGGTRGLVAIGLILVLALGATSIADRPFHGGMGNRTYRPANLSELKSAYRLGIGDLTLDLSRINVSEGTRRVKASVGIGQVTVLVPVDAEVDITGRAGVGDVRLLGVDEDGANVEQSIREHGTSGGVLRLEVRSGVGQVDVVRVERVAA